MFNLYPYTDFHELNLDMILRMIKELHKEWSDFEAVNKITNAGAWDITKQYQAWTIVSDNNVGYISLKPVPAGVAITNTEYWGLVADYDILITDLSNRISTLEGQMNTLNNTTIPAINAELDLIENRNFLVCGDSYMAQDNTPGQYDYTSWKAPHFMQKTMNVPDSKFHLFAVSGTAFYDSSFVSQLQDPAALALANDITDIVVVGGLNDCNHATVDIENGMDAFLSFARANYPNCKRIYLGFAGSASDNSASLAGRNILTRLTARFTYEVRGAEKGFLIIPDLVESWDFGLSWFYSGDYVHPSFNSVNDDTECGASLLGRAVGNFLIGGFPTTNYLANPIALGTNNLYYNFDKEFLTLMSQGLADNFIVLNFGPQSLGSVTFTQGLFYFNKKIRIKTRATIVYNNGGSANNYDVILMFDGYNITVVLDARDSSGNTITLSNATIAYLDPIIQIPRKFVA